MEKHSTILPREVIEQRIYFIRGQKVLLSNHLAELYQVKHKVLMQSIQRNRKRFPNDFLLQVTSKELAQKLEELEQKYDGQFKIVFEALHQILAPPEKPKRPFGFTVEEPKAQYSIKKKSL